jgi:ribosomal protein L21E
MDNNEIEIKTGDFVQVIVNVWSEDETPTVKNFYEGKVTEIVERAKHCFYVKLEGLDRLIPIDRARTA